MPAREGAGVLRFITANARGSGRDFVFGDVSEGCDFICGRPGPAGYFCDLPGPGEAVDDIVRMAGAGEIVGLAGTLSGKTYELTAEAMEPLEANFIPRESFVQFLKEHAEAAVRVAELLSSIYHATLLEVRYLGFSSSTAEKLARFLLDLPLQAAAVDAHPRATLTLTHKEIGETIGASRETVTRLFASFKREGLIEVHGATVVLSHKAKLQQLVAG
jgi:CRP/FNR family transcriptional regulator